MARLTLFLQQQSGQHSNPQRNARCSGLTGRAKQQVFRVEGSYTANLWTGMPASTSWAPGWMLVTVGSCSIPTSPCLPCGQAHDAQSLPASDNVGKASWHTIPLSAIPLVSTGCPGRGTGLVAALQLPSRALPANPSLLIPLPAHVPLALCSGPNAHPA